MGSNNSNQLVEYTDKKKNERDALDVLWNCLRHSSGIPIDMKVFFNVKLYDYICKYGRDNNGVSNMPFSDTSMTFFSQ